MKGSRRFSARCIRDPEERATSAIVDTTPICDEAMVDEFYTLFMIPPLFFFTVQ